MWQKALDTFLAYFEACKSQEESTHEFTSTQLYNMLTQHCGETMTIHEMATYLEEKGFYYYYDGDLTLTWIFKQKHQP